MFTRNTSRATHTLKHSQGGAGRRMNNDFVALVILVGLISLAIYANADLDGLLNVRFRG
jgi:hypothetical protein